MEPYRECIECIAKTFCKRYSGDIPRPSYPDWCNPRFRLYKALELSNMPLIYQTANLYSLNVDEDNFSIIEKIKLYVQHIMVAVDKGVNFFFFGPRPGTGKTHCASVLLNHYIYNTCLTDRFDFEHPLSYYYSYARLMDTLRYDRNDGELEDVLNKVKTSPLLLLDDVGVGTFSEYVREQVYLILDYRINNNLSTVVTSNFSPEELQDQNKFGNRLVSRLLRNCRVLEFSGKDRRVAKAEL